MPDSQGHVRVGIVTWRSADVIGDCLDALPAALDGLPHDVVVVDNASGDGSAEMAAGRGVTVVRNEDNRGYAAAMNQALRHDDPQAAWLIALNPDTVPAPGSLRRLVDELAVTPGAAVAVPLLVHADGVVQHSVHRFPSLRLAVLANLLPVRWLPAAVRDRWWLPGAVRDDRAAGEVDWAMGAVHVLRADATANLVPGPYDEQWWLYVEDLDLSWRLGRAGWATRFVPDAVVTHVGDVSGRQAHAGGSRLRWLDRSYRWYRQQHGGLSTRLYAGLNALGELRTRLARRLRGHDVGVLSPSVRLHLRVAVGRHDAQ